MAALLLRKSIISSFGVKPLPVSGGILFFCSSSNASNLKTLTSISDFLINQHDFSPELALEVSSQCKSTENVYSLINLLKDNGFSQSQLVKAISRGPFLVRSNVDTIQQKLKVFRDLGFKAGDIANMLSADPWVLNRRTECLVSCVSALTKVLGSLANVKFCTWCWKANLDKTMLPNIEFLKQCGVDSEQIARYVAHSPKFLLHKPEKIQEFVKMIDRLGVPRQSGRYLSAVRIVSSMSSKNWGCKWDLFKSLGFSEDEIMYMFRRLPLVFGVSDMKIRDVWNVMTGTENVSLSALMSCPEVFLCSVEKRLKPRLKVYRFLESRNLLQNKIKLITLCTISDKRYLKFVSQYADELGDEFAACKSFKRTKHS